MGAISENYTNADAAVKAVSAGCDMLLCVSNISSVVDALTEAARSLEHVLMIQRQENRLHVETNFLMFFDGHDDYPFPCSAALSPVPC